MNESSIEVSLVNTSTYFMNIYIIKIVYLSTFD